MILLYSWSMEQTHQDLRIYKFFWLDPFCHFFYRFISLCRTLKSWVVNILFTKLVILKLSLNHLNNQAVPGAGRSGLFKKRLFLHSKNCFFRFRKNYLFIYKVHFEHDDIFSEFYLFFRTLFLLVARCSGTKRDCVYHGPFLDLHVLRVIHPYIQFMKKLPEMI
jgi:hypothetical protein